MTDALIAARNIVSKHVQANDTYYVDLGPLLHTGETVSSATVATTDSAMTVASPTVLASNTTVIDDKGQSLTIEASTGISFTMSGGTVSETEATVTVVFTKSTGKVDAVDCKVVVGGVEA